MSTPAGLLENLALVICTAAITTVLFRWLRQPVVLGYILAGLLVGPHFPWLPFVAEEHALETLSELGVILLMFSIGLEFSLRRVVRLLPTAGFITALQVPLTMWAGFATTQALGWTFSESVFAGAILTVSSSMILARAVAESPVEAPLRQLLFGVTIVEDLVAVVLLALLTAYASGSAATSETLVPTLLRLAAFLVLFTGLGLFLIPRLVRVVVKTDSDETILVASIGVCFAAAWVAKSFGYSVALGAFLIGSMVAESGAEARIERLVRPVRDMFAGIFFVSVGMLIVPAEIAANAGTIAALFGVLIVGRAVSIALGAALTGHGIPASVRAGLSLAQIGEFSFIMAGIGVTLGSARPFLYSVAVALAIAGAIANPWLVRASGPLARWIDRKLPRTLQTFVALHGAWLEELRRRPAERWRWTARKRLALLLVLDAVCLSATIVAAVLCVRYELPRLSRALGIDGERAYWTVVVIAAAMSIPFVLGSVRIARRLAVLLALEVMPGLESGRADLAAAPRRALVVALQLALVLMAGLGVLAVTQPFLPLFRGVPVLILVLVVLAIAGWNSAANLQGHVRAGAQVIVEALLRRNEPAAPPLADVQELLPGFGQLRALSVEAHSTAVGKTLSDLDLRGTTGATVVCIARAGHGILDPRGDETLHENDQLAITGSHEAVEAARSLLNRTRESG